MRKKKHHPQKSLSNSTISVVKNLSPSSYKILFHGDVLFILDGYLVN